jgi:hypothetical protein
MQENSEQLSAHLKNILSLSDEDTSKAPFTEEADTYTPMQNAEILNSAMQHDLPIVAGIDGSLANGDTTVSISIVAPDMRNGDIDMEWQHQPAKVLLIRSWKLP